MVVAPLIFIKSFLKKIVITINKKKAIILEYKHLVLNQLSAIPVLLEFFSITLSNPLPIEIIKNVCGKIPIMLTKRN